MGAYDIDTDKCPYCKGDCHADWVDVDVGMVQCGPFQCESCGASEIGPEFFDWLYKDREGNTLYLPGKRRYFDPMKKKIRMGVRTMLIPGYPFTEEEIETGYYRNEVSPYANTVNGKLVDHVTAKDMYSTGLLDNKNI